MERIWERISRIIYPTIAGICFLLMFLCIPFTYGINDDMTMRDIAAGAVSGTPDGHLVYIQYVLGKPLSLLFQAWKGVDWYALFFLSVIFLCYGLVLYRFWVLWKEKATGKCFGLFCAVTFFVVIYLRYFVNFQYTIAASITGGTAIFYYFTLDTEKKSGKRFRDYAVVLTLLWLTCCIRVQVFLLAVPFAGIMFFYKKGLKTAEKAGIVVLALLGLLGIFVTEQNAYFSSDWKDFRRFNQARTDIFDYYGVPPYDENQDFYQSIGMEECDVVNLERYNLYMIDGIEDRKLEQTAVYAKQLWKESGTPEQKVKNGMKLALEGFLNRNNLMLNTAEKVLLLSCIIWALRKRRSFWIYLCLASAEGILWLYLGYKGRLPDRVGASLLMIAFLCILASVFEICRKEEKNALCIRKSLVTGACIVMMAVSGFSLASVRKEQLETVQRNQEFERFQSWFTEHRSGVYFYPVAFLGGYTENLSLFRTFALSNNFALGGWMSFAPPELEGLEKFGIEKVDKALIENDNIYLVMTTPSSRVDEHYQQNNIEIIWEQRDQLPAFQTEVPVWRLHAEGDET